MVNSNIDWDEIRLAVREQMTLESEHVLKAFERGDWHGTDTEAVKKMAVAIVEAAWDIGTRALDRGFKASKLVEGHAKGAMHRIVGRVH